MKNTQKTGLVIMASGQSRRFGSNKLMADLCGKPMIEYILAASDGLFDNRVVVTRSEEVARYCEKRNTTRDRDINTVLHQYEDRNDVVRMGIEAIEQNDSTEACVFAVADQPLITSASLHNIIKTQKKELLEGRDTILKASFNDRIGNPMCFPSSMYVELKSLPAKMGGNFLTKRYADKVKYVELSHEYELFDIDTVDALKEVALLLSNKFVRK